MDKQTRYCGIVKQAICASRYFVYGSKGPDVETLFITDDAQGRYILMDAGWRGKERILNIILFVQVKHQKCWIEEDWTEDGITQELLEAGVPHDDIVLAFHPPHLRPLTDFAAV
jgi:hypothetical protein